MAEDKIEVPRWALEFIMENASFIDEGPGAEGWCSDKMERAVKAIDAAQVLADRIELYVTFRGHGFYLSDDDFQLILAALRDVSQSSSKSKP